MKPEPVTTPPSDKLRIRRLRKVLREALREKNVSEGSLNELLHNIEWNIRE